MIYIGIDVGGTTIKVGVVDGQGNILCKDSCPTGAERGYQAMVKDMADLTLRLTARCGHTPEDIHSIGIGIPGINDPATGRVPYCNNLFWYDVPLIEEMHRHFDVPIHVENDASVAALAESVAGVSAGVPSVMFITLGTGVGGGYIVNGKVFSGAHGVGTEVGHMIVVDGGEPCNCGANGCWERYCSASALVREGKKLCWKKPDCALARAVKGNLDDIGAREIIGLAKTGDPDCAALFDRYVHYLCVGLVNLINILDPDMFVLGGGVSNAGDFLLDAVRARLPEMVFCKSMPYARVEIATLTNDAGIIGAAMLGK